MRLALPNIASTSKRNFSRNKRSYNSLTKQGINNNYIE